MSTSVVASHTVDVSGAPIAALELPKQVIAALVARFPGAEATSSVISNEDGATKCDVTTVAEDTPIIQTRSTPSSDRSVQVVALDTETDPEPGHFEISPSTLPPAVLVAMRGTFPGADLADAEFSIQDGQSEYATTALVHGESIDVTLTPDGTITETDYARQAVELPQSVLDWVKQNYPDSEISHAGQIVTSNGTSYDVVLASANHQKIEATLRLMSQSTPTAAKGVIEASNAVALDETSPPSSDAYVDDAYDKIESSEGLASIAQDGPSSESRTANLPDFAVAQAPSTPEGHPRGTASTVDLPPSGDSTRAGAPATLVASINMPVWLPQIVGLLNNVLPIDFAAIEQRTQAIVQQIDGMVDNVVNEAASNHLILRFATVTGLIVGTQLIVHHARKSRVRPAVVFSAAHSNWSWVLGSTTTHRNSACTGDRYER